MDTLVIYRETARERVRRTTSAIQQRREKAWNAARTAAELLKTRYQATRVVVFGSITQAERFHLWSDLDLAAWGLPPGDYFEAVARVLDVGGEIKIDLIMAERCKSFLQEEIESGVDL